MRLSTGRVNTNFDTYTVRMPCSRQGRPPYNYIITPREWRVLALVRLGLTNHQIGQHLGITLDGVKYHVSNMLSKLYLLDRQDLATWNRSEGRTTMATIVKVAKRGEWEEGKLAGTYAPTTLESDGFIHCSPLEEAAGVANYHYSGHTDLVLLYIDTERLTSELRFHDSPYEDVSWPRIHGRLNVDAVFHEIDLVPDADGLFPFRQPSLNVARLQSPRNVEATLRHLPHRPPHTLHLV